MRILFFMLSAARTGSETALYNFIEHAAGKDFELGVACRYEGALLKQMPPGVPTYLFGKTPSLPRRAAGAARRWLTKDLDDLSMMEPHRKFKPDIWYVNTLLQPPVLRQARKNNIPCVLHTHELEQMLPDRTETDVDDILKHPRLVVAGSRAAGDVLRTLGRGQGIEVCYENINPARIKWSPQRSREIRRGLGIGEDTFVWAMSGTLDPNKNPVRFVEVAREMLGQGLDVHFVWVGAAAGAYGLYAMKKAGELGVADKVSWLGERSGEDYYDCLNAADGLVLTSFKESFSIVTVEAAHLGKPVVSFDCGGTREIIREGMGTIVESWNNSDLIRALVAVMRGETRFDPRVARERAEEFHIGVQGPRWEKVMREYFVSSGRVAGG